MRDQRTAPPPRRLPARRRAQGLMCSGTGHLSSQARWQLSYMVESSERWKAKAEEPLQVRTSTSRDGRRGQARISPPFPFGVLSRSVLLLNIAVLYFAHLYKRSSPINSSTESLSCSSAKKRPNSMRMPNTTSYTVRVLSLRAPNAIARHKTTSATAIPTNLAEKKRRGQRRARITVDRA